MGYSTLPISKLYRSLFLTGLILFQYFPPLVYADESKTIERLIELTEPGGQAVQEKVAQLMQVKKPICNFVCIVMACKAKGMERPLLIYGHFQETCL